jgi:tetratricopeptide (TPR) repeat protein
LDSFRRQQFETALEEFEQAGKAQPNDATIENLIGITETQLSRIPDANTHYKRAILLNPKLPGPHKNLGFNSLSAKQYQLADQELKIALALDPQDQFTHYYLATLYLATSKDQEAVSELNPSRSLLEDDPDNEFLMAKACFNTNRTADGLALVETLAARSELSVSQNYELATLLTRKQMYADAVRRFQNAVAMQPTSWECKYNLAIAWLDAGDADKAVAVLEPLAIDQPENATVLSLLGSAYESLDQLPEALDAYQKAVRADPQNPDRYLDYTRLLMDLDRTDEATRVVEEGIRGTPDAYALDIRLGVLQVKRGKYDDAREAFNLAVGLHPDIVMGYVALAQTYMQQGRDQEALEPLNTARKKLPQDATLEYYVGMVSLRLGLNDQALTALRNAERLRPDVVEPHYQLGRLYFQKNQLRDAEAEFERVVTLAPDHSNAHYQLSQIYLRLGDTKRAQEMAAETKRLIQAQRENTIRLQRKRLGEFQAPSSE